jgi:hypothetical protein
VVQLPAGPPAWAIGSGPFSGYQSVLTKAKAIVPYEIHGTNGFMLDRFNLRIVGSMIARARGFKKTGVKQ